MMMRAGITEAHWLSPEALKELEGQVRHLMAENRVTVVRQWNSPDPVSCTYHAPSWEKFHLSHFVTGPWEVHYPHQWLWDSCAHAIILASLEPALAREEVRSLLYAQQGDGFIPHVIIHPRHRHTLGLVLAVLGRSPHISPYLQPPLLAEAVATVYHHTRDWDFLVEVLPKLVAFYDYIHRSRCLSADGLPEIIISYESGMDRSPEYDIIYGRSTAGSLLRGPLARILVHHWRLKHDLPRIIAAQRFRVKDLLFNCVYARNQYILAGLLDTAGETALAQSFRERARLTEAAILSKMYSPGTGLFHSLDARYDRDVPVPVATLSTFMPLLLPTIPLPRVEVLAGRLSDPQSFGAHYPVPVEPLSAYAQTPRTHIIWRGMQSWILPNWLIYQGLLLQAHRFPSLAAELTNLAQGLAQRSYELVQQHGFWEYYHSETGKPGGAVHFAWSGLVWNMSQPEQAEAGFFGHLYP